ncbi:hypothetical protein EOD39_0582 [Acipenser ruthenus]|uniref:Lymphoid-restricted membrane protein n=1 Tax=Acipenser ruthenus TaxID=7906 RepID=A0A444TZ93_ACIRT|nr:hypothetical protein EOD39_0582 [Acipenser ruthenus]
MCSRSTSVSPFLHRPNSDNGAVIGLPKVSPEDMSSITNEQKPDGDCDGRSRSCPGSIISKCDVKNKLIDTPSVGQTVNVPTGSCDVYSCEGQSTAEDEDEDDIISSVFKICDPAETVFEIVQNITGAGDDQLGKLLMKLDEEQLGVYLDFPTFQEKMKQWIEDCRNARKWVGKSDAIAELVHSKRRLSVENEELHKTVEMSDSTNTHLLEENVALKSQIKRQGEGDVFQGVRGTEVSPVLGCYSLEFEIAECEKQGECGASTCRLSMWRNFWYFLVPQWGLRHMIPPPV